MDTTVNSSKLDNTKCIVIMAVVGRLRIGTTIN